MDDVDFEPFFAELTAAIEQASTCEGTRRQILEMSRQPRVVWSRPMDQLVQMVLYGWEHEFSINDFNDWTHEDVAAGLFIIMKLLAQPLSGAGARLYAAVSYIWLPLAASRLLFEAECHGG